MQYHSFGNTGVKVSVLGFGAMRLPQERIEGKSQIKQEESVEIIQKAFELGINYVDTAYVYNEGDSELALRFVLANEKVSVALSGMGSMRMVEENVRAVSLSTPLSNEELQTIEAFIKERRKKEEIPCNMCEYCQPCPSQVAISRIFELMNYYRIYGLKEYALREYKNIGSGEKDEREKADACTECGECEEKCPQKIKIMEKLKECHQALG